MCQRDITTATVEIVEADCQMDKNLRELAVLQRKGLKYKIVKSRNDNFTEEFLIKKIE